MKKETNKKNIQRHLDSNIQTSTTERCPSNMLSSKRFVKVLNEFNRNNKISSINTQFFFFYDKSPVVIIVLVTFGEGTTVYVFIILSGYSSLIFPIIKVPIPDPVPPPMECVNWNP